MTIAALSAAELVAKYKNATLSPVEVFHDVLQRIDELPPAVNAFCHRDDAAGLTQAKASEARWLKGTPLGPADGIPATVKSNIPVTGWPARRGSRTVSDAPVTIDAPATARLRAAGCVFVGSTTMPEFGWKGVGDSPLTGISRNPWDLARTPGGSSAGAAIAAALGLGLLHVGSDGLGSIRIPASFSGVFGIKPSFNRVPAYPASPFGVLSHIGPLTRSVADAALMLSIISGPDVRDLFAMNGPAPDFGAASAGDLSGLRVAWSARLGFVEKLDPEVLQLTEAAARRFGDLGAKVEDADPGFDDPISTANLFWHTGAATILEDVPAALQAEMDPGFLREAERGKDLKATQFAKALTARALLHEHMLGFHSRFDLLLTPTMPITALQAGLDTPADGSYGDDWTNWSPYTYPFNITGQPAASVPCGLTKAGLPVGLQIVAPRGRDDLVIRAARVFEAASPFERLVAVRGKI